VPHTSRTIGLGRRGRLFHGKQRGDELALSALIKGKAELEETHQPQHKGPLLLRVIFHLQHMLFYRIIEKRYGLGITNTFGSSIL
jgi:hypothetical protein